MTEVSVLGRDERRARTLAARLAERLDLATSIGTDGDTRIVVPSSPFADQEARLAATGGRVLVRWDDLPELRQAVADRLTAASGADAKAVLVVPAFPATTTRDEGELIDDVDRFGREAVEAAGLDPWAAAAIAWEPDSPADDYGVRTIEVIGGLADLGRTNRVVVVPVGVDADHPGVVAAQERGEAAGLTVETASRADTDGSVLDALAARLVEAAA
ncbi:MAG: hypothetical protein AAGD18_17675 [Actinomycetota bacterium]